MEVMHERRNAQLPLIHGYEAALIAAAATRNQRLRIFVKNLFLIE
jgi:hypothetical protein